jgi:DNA-directed RNA polymerase specialized sigma24 family protein
VEPVTELRRVAPETVRQQVTALYQAHALGLVRLAVLMVGDQPTAEDVVQDAFLGLYRRWSALKGPERAPSYARSSVLNAFMFPVGLAGS